MRKIKIYGERNTGTNYLEKLVSLNFKARVLPGVVPLTVDRVAKKIAYDERARDFYFRLTSAGNLGWKHRELPSSILESLRPDTFIVCLVKNPYSWLLSMHRRAYHYQGSVPERFVDFLACPWATLRRESDKTSYENAIVMWNEKVSSYYHFIESGKCKIIRYEDLLASPFAELRKLKDQYDIPIKEGFPQNYNASAKAGDPSLGADYYLDYYGKERWKNKIDGKSIAYINRFLNKDLMGRLGYGVL